MEVVHEPVRGNGCVEAGRQGVRPGRRRGAAQDGRDGDDLGVDHERRSCALREHLIAERVSWVVMEATGDYWKPFYYLLEDAGFEVMLVNARHVKNLPGPQDRRLRRHLAGPARRARAGPGLVRAAGSRSGSCGT